MPGVLVPQFMVAQIGMLIMSLLSAKLWSLDITISLENEHCSVFFLESQLFRWPRQKIMTMQCEIKLATYLSCVLITLQSLVSKLLLWSLLARAPLNVRPCWALNYQIRNRDQVKTKLIKKVIYLSIKSTSYGSTSDPDSDPVFDTLTGSPGPNHTILSLF